MNRAQNYQRARDEQAALDHLKRTVIKPATTGADQDPVSRVETVTPAQAATYLANQRANRRVRATRVLRYATAIKDGKWALNGQGLIFNREGQLMDGQHRCHAIVQAGVAMRTMVTRGIDDAVWATIDQVSAREPADALAARGVAHSRSLAAAIKLLYRDEVGAALNNTSINAENEDVVEMATEDHPDICVSARWASSANANRFCTKTILTYAHYRAGLIDVSRRDWFFDRLSSGEGLGKGSAVHVLRERLISDRTQKARLPSEEVLALLIKAWGHYVTQRTVKCLRWRAQGDQAETWPQWLGLDGKPHVLGKA